MKKLIDKRTELLNILAAINNTESENDYKVQTISDIQYQIYKIEEEIYHCRMMFPLKLMLLLFTIGSIIALIFILL